MFPYPSGQGLHVGHPLGYIATDVMGRFKRMTGHKVLHALAYDAFGLPAEQYALQTNQHPRVTTDENIAIMRRQLHRLGLAHDPCRSFATTDDDYVKWTQWIFLQIFNSWFDPDHQAPDGSTGSARPIETLIEQFRTGKRPLPTPFEGKKWDELTGAEQEQVLGEFRLAYVADVPVNWCPGLGTVLANEEVTAEGLSERGNYPVYQRNLRQWMMRITSYADRLLADLDRLDWPEKVKIMQRNWIGRSTGANVTFRLGESETGSIDVFTTRPDTLFGATFMVFAPEHPELDGLVPSQWPQGTKQEWTGGYATPEEAVAAYRIRVGTQTEAERTDDAREKTGVFTGVYATNPVNGKQIPVFIADYVLMGYGTGAIMAVPAQDDRDWDFAEAFNIDVVRTVAVPQDHEGPWLEDGTVINSANNSIDLNGLDTEAAKSKMIQWLQEQHIGQPTVSYRLRDWLFSRQRYWGEPFPVVYDEQGRIHALPAEMLPVTLPEMDDFTPRTYADDDVSSEPETPLSRAEEWVNVELDLGDGPATYRRDTNTMPNWAGSCWYELRYLDPTNDQRFVDPQREKYWMGPRSAQETGGADLYVGGVEHAVLHLLYARFWHKILFDLGHLSSLEPFAKLFNQGYIQAYAYTDDRGVYVPAEEVEERVADDGVTQYWWNGQQVNREYGKMGKSLNNMITPDQMYAEYGADTFRLYEMSMGPLDQSRAWETRAVVGAQRFLQRLWRNVLDEHTGELVVVDSPPDEETTRLLHKTIDDVRTELEHMRPNTAIARLTVLNNHLTGLDHVPRQVAEALVIMVAPFAPHIAEELWHKLGHDQTLTYVQFPTPDPQWLVEETVTCIVQVNGKLRDRLEVEPSISAEALQERALEAPGVVRALHGAGVRRVIVREPKLVNIVPEK